MDVEEKAIERIRTGSEMSLGFYGKPLVCAFLRSGIPFEVHHSHTTADAPQTVQHIRKVFRGLELSGISCNIDYHARTNRRRLFEKCGMKAKTVVNPIVDWSNYDVWDFYRSECKCRNPLYDMGFTRVGCIGCPMSGKTRWMEFREFPAYREMYVRAFDMMLDARKEKGLEYKNEINKEWKSGEDVFSWWMEDKNTPGQMKLEDFMEDRL